MMAEGILAGWGRGAQCAEAPVAGGWRFYLRLPAATGALVLLVLASLADAQTGTRSNRNPESRDGAGTSAETIAAADAGVSMSKKAGEESTAIRPFAVKIPQEQLEELRQRVKATRWPSRETVGDRSQGVQLAKVQELVRYWGTQYDWRRVESRLNAFPHFMTNIDGLDIHFIHVRSRHKNALPLIITHGWPGSVLEQIGVIGP